MTLKIQFLILEKKYVSQYPKNHLQKMSRDSRQAVSLNCCVFRSFERISRPAVSDITLLHETKMKL
jgi:hypothetical protein